MKDIYKKISLFDDYLEDDEIVHIVDQIDDFTLFQYEKDNNTFEYKVFDDSDIMVAKWDSKEDCLSMAMSDYKRSNTKRLFVEVIRQEKISKKQFKKQDKYSYYNTNYNKSTFADDADEEKYYYPSTFKYTPPKKSTGFLDKLNKSDTLVIHCQDRTTEMLCQIYEGRNWDVIRDGNIDKDELHQLLQSHDKIICLGHGTPGGLLNKQGGGYVVGHEEAKYLKDKKLFIIWCYASSYASTHGLHGFITGNMPSDKWEARAVGYDVGEKYMDDNITYWSKCCADYVDQALSGDYAGAAKNIVRDYLAVYGDETKWNEEELGITKYNADRTTAV